MKLSIFPNIHSSWDQHTSYRVGEGHSGEIKPGFALNVANDSLIVAEENNVDYTLPEVMKLAVKESKVVEHYIFCSCVQDSVSATFLTILDTTRTFL